MCRILSATRQEVFDGRAMERETLLTLERGILTLRIQPVNRQQSSEEQGRSTEKKGENIEADPFIRGGWQLRTQQNLFARRKGEPRSWICTTRKEKFLTIRDSAQK